jgi:hypothetical protein
MKLIRTTCSLFLLALLLPALCLAQASVQTDDVQKLRDQIAAQQKQLDEQRQALDAQQKALDAQQKLLDRLIAAQSAPAAAPAAAAPAQPAAALAQPAAAAVPAAQVDTQGRALSPLAFHIGGADFAPGGFMDFTTLWRSTNVGSGVATSFGGLPLSNTAAGRLGELRTSGQNSRLTLKITDHPTKSLAVTGYVEVDFSGTQPVNGYVTSNSNTLRLRQYWADLQTGKWDVLAGQAWTLLTPNRAGISSVPADLFIGLGEDANYLAGLIWGRAGLIRVVYHPDKHWALAASVENPEQYVTAATTLPASTASQIGNGTATSTPNVRPDFIAKIAYDTKVSGKALHFEVAGLSRQFRTSPAPGTYYGAQALGGSFNAVLEVVKHLNLIATSFYSSGGGRYIAGLGPDLIVGPNGSISPVHSMAGIAGFEYAPSPKSQFFAYYGGTYFDRNYAVVSPGSYLGFGFPGSSTATNRQIQEPTFGYVQTFWRNPNYGALQFITQYAYVTRALWYAAPGTPSTAHANMLFGALRFTLP